jgi:hypothetical protein
VVFVSVVLRSADTCSTPGWCTSHADEAPRWTPRTFAKYPTANESHRRCRGEHRERLSTHHWYEFRMYGGLKWEGWTSFNQIISMFTVGCINVSHIRVGGGVWLRTKTMVRVSEVGWSKVSKQGVHDLLRSIPMYIYIYIYIYIYAWVLQPSSIVQVQVYTLPRTCDGNMSFGTRVIICVI